MGYATVQVIDKTAKTNHQPVDFPLVMTYPAPVLRFCSKPSPCIKLEKQWKYPVGIEAITIFGSVVHQIGGRKCRHTGVDGHDGAGQDFVLPLGSDVFLSADKPQPPLKHD